MKNDIAKCIEIYKNCLAEGNIQRAYIVLMKFVAELKGRFPKEYQTGNVSFGYMDYTYFPFFNKYLREKKLRFGVVLNHEKMQFELWLMGQNADVQKEYWKILKNTIWNSGVKEMPKYSVLEICIEDDINFDKKDEMTVRILDKAVELSIKVEDYMRAKE